MLKLFVPLGCHMADEILKMCAKVGKLGVGNLKRAKFW
jgi:hypothetical protein